MHVILLASLLLVQDTVRFTPTVQQPTFAVRDPVARIKSGTVLVSKTHFGPYYSEQGGAFPGEVGPFYVEGATTHDMLKVEIIRVRPNSRYAASQVYSDFGGLATDTHVRLLNEPIKARRYLWQLDTVRMVGSVDMPNSRVRRMEIDLKPMLGRVAVAPRGAEQFAGLWPGDFGGNMDAPEVSVGNTLYLPVNVEGALLYMGDGHAAMGDGEVAGTAIEAPLRGRLQLDVIKGQKINWPRFENDHAIMAVGIYRPLDDALRIAFTELVGWIHHDYGLSELDAYELLSKVAKIHLDEMVDPNYVIVASIEKKYLPPKKK